MNRQTSMHVQLSITHSTRFSKTRQRALAAAGSCAPGQWDDGALTRSKARRPGDHCRKVSFDFAAGGSTRPVPPNLQVSASRGWVWGAVSKSSGWTPGTSLPSLPGQLLSISDLFIFSVPTANTFFEAA